MNRFTLFAIACIFGGALALASCNVADNQSNSLLVEDSCPAGQSFCSGACYDLSSSAEACGSCTLSCQAGEICSEGACERACPAGYVACDDTCVNPQNNPNWCGATDPCDTEDTSLQCADEEVCTGGTCQLVCGEDTIDCNDRCVDPNVDREFCGATGNCSGGNVGETCLDTEVCDRGTCSNTCPTGSIPCDGGCIDPDTNPRFCGASASCTGAQAGTVCAGGDRCTEGTCEVTCTPDRLVCDGRCIDPTTNPDFCGAVDTCMGTEAGEVCRLGESCLGGTCFPTNYFLFSPFNTVGTRSHPRDLAYRVDTLIEGVTMHYTVDGSVPVPTMGTTESTDTFVETEPLTNNQQLRVVFEIDGELSGPVTLRHRTDANLPADVNTPDNFAINGGGIVAEVEPGAAIDLTFDLLIWKLLAETSAQAVYYVDEVGIIHCESLAATPPGMEKSLDLDFNAPMEPGTYFVYSAVTYESDCASVSGKPANLEAHAVVKVR